MVCGGGGGYDDDDDDDDERACFLENNQWILCRKWCVWLIVMVKIDRQSKKVEIEKFFPQNRLARSFGKKKKNKKQKPESIDSRSKSISFEFLFELAIHW